MNKLTIAFLASISLVAVAGCKKKNADAPAGGSATMAGSAETPAATPSMAGSAAPTPAPSMAGSAAPAMAGSGEPAMAGSGSAMAGSGEPAMAGSGSAAK
jgi:hypothetical protein